MEKETVRLSTGTKQHFLISHIVVICELTNDNVTRCRCARDWTLWHSSITAARHPRKFWLWHHLQAVAALASPWWKVDKICEKCGEKKAFLEVSVRFNPYPFKWLNVCVLAYLYESVCYWSVVGWGIQGQSLPRSRGSFLQCEPAGPSPLSPPCGSGCLLGAQSALRY